MTLRQRLRTVAVCAMLEFAALTGMTVRPEEIRELMQTMHRPKVAHTIPQGQERSEGEEDLV
jgi:hypothetical protein